MFYRQPVYLVNWTRNSSQDNYLQVIEVKRDVQDSLPSMDEDSAQSSIGQDHENVRAYYNGSLVCIMKPVLLLLAVRFQNCKSCSWTTRARKRSVYSTGAEGLYEESVRECSIVLVLVLYESVSECLTALRPDGVRYTNCTIVQCLYALP
jgi:hypothetical protein